MSAPLLRCFHLWRNFLTIYYALARGVGVGGELCLQPHCISIRRKKFLTVSFCLCFALRLFCCSCYCYWFCTRLSIAADVVNVNINSNWLLIILHFTNYAEDTILNLDELFRKLFSLISSGRNFAAQLQFCAPASADHRGDLIAISWQG